MSNSKRFAPKYKIKKGDKVKVIAGSNKGAEGNVLEVHAKNGKAIVEGVNLAKKHTKPTQDNPGGINEIALPIDISNLMFVDPKSGETTRLGYRIEDGKSVRYSKKSGETIK
ncbi:MAG: 50S ribosomal protein L24 [Saprospiraceae bacterium]|nr:50S ribosomal protein L24 [Saprospiraceae bacterium]